MESCEVCGFVYEDVVAGEIPERMASFGPRYRTRLVSSTDPPVACAGLRNRVDIDVWTALEYACHVRDIFEVQHQRLALALAEDCPTIVPMGREERVVTGRYNQQDPLEVAVAIKEQAEAIGEAFARLSPAEWERTAIYNWPASAERTMVWLARHTVHEGEHHLGDMDHLLGRPDAGPSG
jgi:DinB superfamily